MSPRRAALLRFVFAALAAVLVAGLTLAHWHAAALGVGILTGIAFFLRGMAAGGSLGNARQFGKAPADVSTRVGICLAAAGIASASLGYHPPFPPPFRLFYGVCLAVGCLGALFLAGRAVRDTPE